MALVVAFSTRHDGNMSFRYGRSAAEVIANREKFLKKFDVCLCDCVSMQAVDSGAIMTVDNANNGMTMTNPEQAPVADTLITNTKNLYLFLLTADCLPLIFYDPQQEAIALAHASRKTTGSRIAERVITAMQEKFKTNPATVHITMGPCIHQSSYILKNDIPEMAAPDWQPYLRKIEETRVAVDVVGYNRDQLISAGVGENNIELSNINTATSPDYFSHYVTKQNNQSEQRFATIVGIK